MNQYFSQRPEDWQQSMNAAMNAGLFEQVSSALLGAMQLPTVDQARAMQNIYPYSPPKRGDDTYGFMSTSKEQRERIRAVIELGVKSGSIMV